MFFQLFKILIFRVVREVKWQKQSKMTKNSVRHASYLRNHTSYDCHLWYTCVCKMMIFPGGFFQFLKIFIFRVVRGVKGQKIVQMTRNYVCCISYLRNYKSCNCHCRMIIFQVYCSFFHYFDFLGP